MNILLTGGAGYIGSHTAVALERAGHQVIILDNFCNSQKDVIGRLKIIIGKEMQWVEGDIRDSALLKKTIQDFQIEAVVHFAGLKAVGESVTNPIEYYANNVCGTISLLEAMKLCNVKNLVFSSSATVYGDPKYLPIDESHPTEATNPYGRSKLHIEQMLKDVATSDLDWRIICLRYFNPVGAHEMGLIGEDPYGIPNNLAPYLTQVAIGKLPKLNIYGDDYPTLDGTGVRDYIHVMDLAEGHVAALDYAVTHSGWSAINLGTGTGHSVLELVKAFEEVTGQPIPYQIVKRRPGDIAACYAQVAAAKDMLGWSAQRDLKDMCASSWKWQKYRDTLAN
jgi:UDP-glucose 4-epimerase